MTTLEDQVTINNIHSLLDWHILNRLVFKTTNPQFMNTATLDKMRSMRLFGMHQAFEGLTKTASLKEYTHEEMMAHLVESEWTDRNNRRLERLHKGAHFRYHASLEQIDYQHPRDLDKNVILGLSNGDYIRKAQNIIIVGATGVGKSFIASALGHQACLLGFKTYYANTYKLFANLKMAKVDGSYQKMIKKIEKHQLLILDDFGLKPMNLDTRMAFMEIIEDRHQRNATIITSQLAVKHWHEVIGESTIADAILDRLVNGAHKIDLEGESMRKKLNKI